jgi:hypothetical protein
MELCFCCYVLKAERLGYMSHQGADRHKTRSSLFNALPELDDFHQGSVVHQKATGESNSIFNFRLVRILEEHSQSELSLQEKRRFLST